MLIQEELIQRVEALCRDDPRVVAALMYGSFAYGAGDHFSDVEFVIFFEDEALASLDRRAWLERVAPVGLYFINDFGTPNVIFENLVRGEFHFHAVSEMAPLVQGWKGEVWFPSLEAVLVVDKRGDLAPLLRPLVGAPLSHDRPERVQAIVDNTVGWLLFGINVLERGELARALELLSILQRHLLLVARVVEGATQHWHIPSRALEEEVSANAYRHFAACTAPLEERALRRAYLHAWRWVRDLFPLLRDSHDITLSEEVMAGIDARFEAWESSSLPAYQRRVSDFVAAHDLEAPLTARLLDLVSEVGELAKEALVAGEYGRSEPELAESWSGELADAFFSLVCLANATQVDLDAVLEEALAKYRTRIAAQGDAGSGR